MLICGKKELRSVLRLSRRGLLNAGFDFLKLSAQSCSRCDISGRTKVKNERMP